MKLLDLYETLYGIHWDNYFEDLWETMIQTIGIAYWDMTLGDIMGPMGER